MTRNPYAHPVEPDTAPDPQSRVSALAVASLVFGLLCCIPGSGLIGTILGGAGLIRISRSEGRLGGRTLAFVGILLGLFGTVAWLAMGVGARQMLATVQAHMFAPTVTTLGAIDHDDWTTARKLLDTKVAASLTDADLATFRDGVRSNFGPVVGDPKSVNIGQLLGSQPSVSLPGGAHTILPFPMEFKQGTAWIVIVTDSPNTLGDVMTGKSIEGQVTNVGIMSGSKQVWLVDPSRPAPSPPSGGASTSPEPPK